jgi:hypothetical protein
VIKCRLFLTGRPPEIFLGGREVGGERRGGGREVRGEGGGGREASLLKKIYQKKKWPAEGRPEKILRFSLRKPMKTISISSKFSKNSYCFFLTSTEHTTIAEN